MIIEKESSCSWINILSFFIGIVALASCNHYCIPDSVTNRDFPDEYVFYTGKCDDYSLFSGSTKTKSVYFLFDSLQLRHPEYISKHIIGESCDHQDIISYEFGGGDVDKPKIIIICSQHGFEKNSTFGTYYFVKDVVDNDNDIFLQFISKHLHLIIVPVANPSGFDSFTYKNADGVNLNRNWSVSDWHAINDWYSSDYSGVFPLDQPETKAINNLIDKNLDSELFIDFHTNGMGVIDSPKHINWISIPFFENKSANNKLFQLAQRHLSLITQNFKILYGSNRQILNYYKQQFGYITKANKFATTGYAETSIAQKGVLSLTFEGFNGFPEDDKPFLPDVAKANSELLGNFIYQYCYCFL